MPFNVSDKSLSDRLTHHLERAKADEANSLTRLATGTVFTPEDPRPGERAIAEKMEARIRSLSAAKRNINDAISFVQTADGAMEEVNNMITRMKEINIAAATTTIDDQERRYLFIEYEALRDEMDRITKTTDFNGIPLLNGSNPKTPDTLVFRLDDPFRVSDDEELGDINAIHFTQFKTIDTTPDLLGIRSAKAILAETDDEEGLSLDDVNEMLLPEDDDGPFPTIYDAALTKLASQRAMFGGLQSRMNRALDFMDVYQENISAAKSRIADTDYAEEITKVLQDKIKIAATTSLLAQSNIDANQTMQLLNRVL